MNSTERTWTVTTWNVRGNKRPEVGELAVVIQVEQPDVVILQEIRLEQAEKLAILLGMRFTWALKHYPFTPLFKKYAEGAAILSPHALDAASHAEISTGKSRWTYRRRIMQWALVGKPDTSAYRIYNAHLSPGSRADERRSEADVASALVAEHGDAPPAIFAGDFNDDTDASVISALPGIEHIPSPSTEPATAPHQALDHVLLPPDARDVALTVPSGGERWENVSDHLPVTVRFTLDWVTGDFV